MTTKGDEIRARERRVLAWSLAIAVFLHIAVLVLWPALRVGPLGASVTPGAIEGNGSGDTYLELLFGAPEIYGPDGSASAEPPTRVLEADRKIKLPSSCTRLLEVGRTPTTGDVWLRVNDSGRVDTVEVVGSTGDLCADGVIMRVAGDLWYRWLPSERFPAPVELIQPVTVTEARR